MLQRAGSRQKILVGVFGTDASFYGMALNVEFVLTKRQLFATGHAQLPFNQIKARDGLCHRVFHLQTRVHLHKEEIHDATGLLLHNELDRAGTHVVHRTGSRYCSIAHGFAHGLRHARCGRFFQHFLVSPLHRAIAFEQVDIVAMCVAEHLNFDVAWALDVFFDQHRVVTKTVFGFAFARGQCGVKLLRLLHHAHAFAAAACAGLDQHRETDFFGFLFQQRRFLICTVITRHQGHTGFLHQLFGRSFEPHRPDRQRRWSDKHQTRIGTGLGESVVLAQKAVPRVHGFSACCLGGFQNTLPLQVTVFGRIATHMHRFITDLDMFGPRISVRINRHRFDRHPRGRGSDSACDFTPIGN